MVSWSLPRSLSLKQLAHYLYICIMVIQAKQGNKMINKNNLIAITNSVIAKELPNNVTLGRWELERLSEAVIKTIIVQVNQNTFDNFVKGNK